jgi:glyoxylase-like metal-dependent hydrolase (beta-lactamase superfamily II)
MSDTREPSPRRSRLYRTGGLAFEVLVHPPPPQNNGFLPNGELKLGSPVASTVIYGAADAVVVDPGFTTGHAQVVGDVIVGKRRNLTDIIITEGHGDRWFAADLLAGRFGARITATAGTIARMYENVATRPLFWDRLFQRIPQSPVTAVTVPGNRFALEDHDVLFLEVGHADTDDNSVLHIPDLALVVAGDVICNGAHPYLGESVLVGGFGPWRDAIDKVEGLRPRWIVAGHKDERQDDDAARTIAETRDYLDEAAAVLRSEETVVGCFNAMVELFPHHLARTVLWAGITAIYAARDNPGYDLDRLLAAGWL